ncbi:ATP-dependent helicase/nuclease AddAB, subunit A, partial [hydrothermal vent metagenome]
QLVRLLRRFRSTNKVMKQRSAFLIDLLPQLLETPEDDRISLLEKLKENAKVQGGGTKKNWDSEEGYEGIKNCLSALRKQIDAAKKAIEITEEDFYAPTEIALVAARVMDFLATRYREEKQKQGILDFNDLLLLTRNLLRDSVTVRNRVAAGINFLMVDEFQDTDPVQADIVRMLCGEELLSGKLFLVGDAKQSIYRFRKADPKVFAALCNEIPKEGQLPLSTNFRSQPEILHFVNCLFAKPFGESYEPLLPFTKEPVSQEPNIEFLLTLGESDPEKKKESAEDLRRHEARSIALRITELLEDETPRIWEKDSQDGHLKLRRVKPGDVMILFRALSNVSLYEEALRQAGIDYYLVGGRAFFAQQEVYDFINLCQWLDDPDDEISLAGLLRSPWFGLSDDTLFMLKQQNKTLSAALQQKPSKDLPEIQQQQIKRAETVLNELRVKKDMLPLAQLLKLALERTGYDASLLHEYLGDRKLANLHKLIEMARTFDSSGMYTLKDFVIQMRESIAREEKEEMAVTLPETGDVVRLMSIHKSKGLEFPVVFVADMDRKPPQSSAGAVYHPQWGPLLSLPKKQGSKGDNPGRIMYSVAEKREEEEETYRLLYVAVTRAADLLILSAGLLSTGKFSSYWMKLLTKQFDIQTGLPAMDPYLGTQNIGRVAPHEIPKIKVRFQNPTDAITKKKTGEEKKLPLSQYRKAVNNVSPILLPETLKKLPRDVTTTRRMSVSQLEEIDAQLQKHEEISYPSTESEPSSVNAATLGTLIHEVIERIDFQSPLPVEEMIIQQMSRSKLSGKEMKEAALRRLTPFWASEIFTEFAKAKQCYREIDFRLNWKCNKKSSVTIVGQIDCLMQTDSGLWKVYDFKTGKLTSQDALLLLQHYEIQMGLYSFACQKLFGQFPDAVELILLQQNKTERLSFVPTKEKMDTLQNRINKAVENGMLTD